MFSGIRGCRSDSHCEQNDRRFVSRSDDARTGPAVDSDGGFADCGRAGVFEAGGAFARWIHREGSREPKYLLVLAIGGDGKAARVGVERSRAVCYGECAEVE